MLPARGRRSGTDRGRFGAVATALDSTEFAWRARACLCVVALPVFVEFADEGIVPWRVPTDKTGLDW